MTKSLIFTSAITFYLVVSSGLSSAQTNVSGGIFSDTYWTNAGSPYIVVDDVVVFPGVNLTIDATVVVKFNDGKKLEVRGNLQAIGVEGDSIRFTSNSVNPGKSSWPGIQVGGSDDGTAAFDYCIFEYANFAVDMGWGWGGDGPIYVKRSRFFKNARGTYGYGNFLFNISDCYFSDNTQAVSSAYTHVSNSTFINNQYGAFQVPNLSVSNSSFCGHDIGLKMGGGPITNCLFYNNDVGIQSYYSISGIDSNIIVNNLTGLVIYNDLGSNNVICNNSLYNVSNYNSGAYNIANNCWCTDDPVEIADKIYDAYDDISYGIMTFTPFNSCDTTSIPVVLDCSFEPNVPQEPLILSVISTGCLDDCLCDATVSASGGTSPYTYLWDDPSSQTNPMAIGLCSGIYSVLVIDANGDTSWVSVNVGGFTNIDFSDGEWNKISVYPNPSHGIFTVDLYSLSGSNGMITVYDILGRAVLSADQHSLKMDINLSNYPSGIYDIHIVMDNGTATRRVILEKP